MFNLIKIKKKGEISLIIGAIVKIGLIVVVTLIILYGIVNIIAPRAEGKTEVELCRTSNEITVGVEHKSGEWVSPTRVCTTIDQTTGKMLVPTKSYKEKYKDDNEAVKAEIRDMIKNCWYMWLEGSESNMFRLYPGEQTCRICYRFKIKDEVGSVNLNELVDSMNNEPYFALIPDNCDPPNGGKWVLGDKCPEGLTLVKKDSTEKRVCCRKGIKFQCENKGGLCCEKAGEQCSTTTMQEKPTSDYTRLYPKWPCPETNKRCYITGDNMITYMEYITESGSNGGNIFIVDPIQDEDDDRSLEGIYAEDTIYAISFVSPAKQYRGGILSSLSWGLDQINPTLYIIKYAGGITGGVKKWVRDVLESDPILEDVPNSIMVSSEKEAGRLNCEMG